MAESATQIELDGQYRALREEAGFLVAGARVLLVSGPDAVDYLQSQLTNDFEAIEPDRGCYAALLDRKGHLVADMRALRLSHDALRDPLARHRAGRLPEPFASTSRCTRSVATSRSSTRPRTGRSPR